MTESPTSIDRLGQMTARERLMYGVDEDREMLSRLNAWETLRKIPVTLINESEPFSDLDNLGFDVFGAIDQPMAAVLGFETISVQIKSSECGINKFIDKGIRHTLFDLWRENRLIVVNGSMTPELRAADVINQLFHYIGIEGDFLRQRVVLEQCDPIFQSVYSPIPDLSCRQRWYQCLFK